MFVLASFSLNSEQECVVCALFRKNPKWLQLKTATFTRKKTSQSPCLKHHEKFLGQKFVVSNARKRRDRAD